MSAEVVIRAARGDDAAVLSVLSGQLGYPVEPEVMKTRVLGCDGVDRALVVAVVGGRIVGCMEVAVMTAWESGRWSEIRGLVVLDGERSRGVGAALVGFAKEWTRGHGLASLRVRTNEIRTRTHGFYERLGFVKTKSQRVYDIDI
ncbi:MAG: GNAT family N-acetyltransferase [Phycisphaerales bacterium]